MDKQVIDAFFGAMIQSREGVSDLLFTVGKPPVVETHGWLEDLLKKAQRGKLRDAVRAPD